MVFKDEYSRTASVNFKRCQSSVIKVYKIRLRQWLTIHVLKDNIFTF